MKFQHTWPLSVLFLTATLNFHSFLGPGVPPTVTELLWKESLRHLPHHHGNEKTNFQQFWEIVVLRYFLTSLGMHDEYLKMSLLDLTQHMVPTNAKWATVSRLQFLGYSCSPLPSVFQVSALGVFWHNGFI